MRTGRFAELDALRGIAAFSVVLSHVYAVLPDLLQQRLGILDSPAAFLILGRPAVILFFVLSGFVLSLSLASPRAPGYAGFVVRRICRIYLPFAAVILAAAMLQHLVQPAPIADLSSWFNTKAWSQPLDPELILAHLAMSGWPGDDTLDPVIWSLVIEMRISLVFPLLFLLVWRTTALTLAVALASLALTEVLSLSPLLPAEPYHNGSLLRVPLLTLYFVSFFVLGILLAMHRQALVRFVGALGGGGRLACGLLALGVFTLERDTAYGLGSALLILLAMGSPSVKRWLLHPGLQWLGHVSYSLYLTHVLVILTLLHLLYGVVPLAVLLLAAIPLSLGTAHLVYLVLERPSTRLGHRLTRRRDAAARVHVLDSVVPRVSPIAVPVTSATDSSAELRSYRDKRETSRSRTG